jgi:hypothetical protein
MRWAVRSKSHDFSENLKELITRQQELAAKLARTGKQAKARAARSKLMVLLNQQDLSQSLLIGDQAVEGRVQQQSEPKVDQQEAAR